jgi:hypothetical protein
MENDDTMATAVQPTGPSTPSDEEYHIVDFEPSDEEAKMDHDEKCTCRTELDTSGGDYSSSIDMCPRCRETISREICGSKVDQYIERILREARQAQLEAEKIITSELDARDIKDERIEEKNETERDGGRGNERNGRDEQHEEHEQPEQPEEHEQPEQPEEHEQPEQPEQPEVQLPPSRKERIIENLLSLIVPIGVFSLASYLTLLFSEVP